MSGDSVSALSNQISWSIFFMDAVEWSLQSYDVFVIGFADASMLLREFE
jgi:hypothetical protein